MKTLTVRTHERLAEAAERFQLDVDAICTEALFAAVARQLPLLKFTPRVRDQLLDAERIAAGLRHDYVGTEHLLLAILADTGGVANTVLRELGLVEPVREKLLEVLASPGYNSSSNRVMDQTGQLVGFMWLDGEGKQYIGDADRTPLRHRRLGGGRLEVLDQEGNPVTLDQDGRLVSRAAEG